MRRLVGRTLARIAAAVAAATLLAASAVAQAPRPVPPAVADGWAGPAIWRISDDDSSVWMLGSVHALAPGVEWRRPAIDAILDEVAVVYLETATDLFSVPRILWFVAQRGYLPPGERLSDRVSPQAWDALVDIGDDVGLAAADLDGLAPWFATLALSAEMSLADGARADLGVDGVLEVAARQGGVDVRYLETPEEQLGFFADVPERDYVAALETLPAMMEQSLEGAELLVDHWRKGKTEQLSALIEESFSASPPSFRDYWLVQRNENWIPVIEAALAEEQDVLVIGGAAHFVGVDSVIDLLQRRGYVVDRF